MESREILREFAGKLAGLSAAAKVVAIAGAVSTMNGTLFAAGKSAEEERRVMETVDRNKVSDLGTAQVSKAPVNTLLASKGKETAKGKTTESKPVVTPKNQVMKPVVASRFQVKGNQVKGNNIAPKIQEKVAIYEPKKESASKPKWDTRYYQPGATVKTPKDTSHPAPRNDGMSSYPNKQKDISFVGATSDDKAFGEKKPSKFYDSRKLKRTRTNSDTYLGTGSRNTALKDNKTDGIGKGSVSTGFQKGVTPNSPSQPTGFTGFSGFRDDSTRPSTPKYDDKTKKALEIAGEIERGEKKLVTSIEEKRAIELQREVSQGKKKLVNADMAARINEQQANVARAEHEVQQLRNELQVVRAEKASQANVAAQPVVQPADIPQVAAVPNAAVPPPPPPPPPPVAFAEGGVPLPPGVPPPPGVPAVPGAGNAIPLPPPAVPGTVNADGSIVPAAPVVPQAPALNAKSATGLLDDLIDTIDRKTRAERMQKIRDEKKSKEDAGNFVATANNFFKTVDAAADSAQAGTAIGIAKSDYLKNVHNALVINEGKSSYAFYDGLIRLLSNIAGKDFADLSNKNPEDSTYKLAVAKRDGCISFLKTSCPAILRAVAYFEQSDKDVLHAAWQECRIREKLPDFLADKYKEGDYYALCADCFKKYDIGLSYVTDIVIRDFVEKMLDEECVRKNRGDVAFRQEQFPATLYFAVSFLNEKDPKVEEGICKRIERKYFDKVAGVALDLEKAKKKETFFTYEDYIAMTGSLQVLAKKGVSDNIAVGANDNDNQQKGSALDRALLAIVKDTEAKQWYDDETIEKMLRDSRNKFILENDKKVMDPPMKRKLLASIREFNIAFLLSCVSEEYATADIKKFGNKQANLRTALKQMLRTVQVSSLIKIEDELKQAWDEGIERYKDRTYIFKLGNRIFKELDGQFSRLLEEYKRAREKGLKQYEQMQTYPIVSKIRKAVMDAGNMLKLRINDEEETELMLNNKKFMSDVLKTALKFSKSTKWFLGGKWVGIFLKDLPLKEAKVTTLVLQKASFNNLKVLNDVSTLESLTFSQSNFYESALNELKLRNVKLFFSDSKNTDTLYTEEGILKRLADAKVTLQFRKCPWVVEGKKPVAVAADPANANPAQGGLPGLHPVGDGGNNNVAGGAPGGNPFGVKLKQGPNNNNNVAGGAPGENPFGVKLKQGPKNNGNAGVGGDDQRFPLPGLKKKGELNAGEKVILKGRGEVQDHAVDMINNIRNQMKALSADANLGDEFFGKWKAIWESDEAETIEADLPGAMFESRANVGEFFDTAVKIANQQNKPLVLIGRFESAHRWDVENKGRVARALLKLKSPLKIASTSQYGTDVVMLNELLTSMTDLKGGDMQLKSVELDRVVSASNAAENQKLLTRLGDLGTETVVFSHLDDAAMEVRKEVTNAQGKKGYKMTLQKFNAWDKEFDFNENSDAWKHLLKKVKVVDLRNNENISVDRLNNLKNLLAEIKSEKAAVAGNADGAHGAKQPEAIALQSILLPDNADTGLAGEIRNLVDELKGN